MIEYWCYTCDKRVNPVNHPWKEHSIVILDRDDGD